MKKRIAVLLVFILGFLYCRSEIVVRAAENEEKSIKQETNGIKSLQIPQKLSVVVDPWELDKKGQVYSEEYVISNIGDTPGILTLSNLMCRPQKQSEVVVMTNKEGLHDNRDKSIYMEMLFGNGEKIVLSQERGVYQTELQPGEELAICITGEVNENAFEKWKDSDIEISVVYSWELKEVLNGTNVKAPDELIQDEDERKRKESSTTDAVGENSSEENFEAVMKESPVDDNELDIAIKDKIKNVKLREPQKVDVMIDSWEVDEKGNIVSLQFLLQNIGNDTGTWTFSELMCKPKEQSAVSIKIDKDSLYESEERSIYMELELGNGENIVLSQESSQYTVELKPGEELKVCFSGGMNRELFEIWEDGDVIVTAVGTWELE